MNLWKEWHRISNKIRTWTFFISLRTQKSEATSISHVSNLTHPSWLVDHFQTSSMLMLLHRTCRWIKCYLFGGSNLANTNFTNQPLIDTFPSYITYWLIPSLPIKTYWLMPSLPIRTYWLMPSPNQNKKKNLRRSHHSPPSFSQWHLPGFQLLLIEIGRSFWVWRCKDLLHLLAAPIQLPRNTQCYTNRLYVLFSLI